MSKARRLVLLKSVVQSILASIYLLPVSLTDELEKMMSSFWWGLNKGEKKGINWLRCDRMIARKEDGDLGFQSLHGFNMAILEKQG